MDDDIALFEDNRLINLTPLLLANDFDLDVDDNLVVVGVDSSLTTAELLLQDGQVFYSAGAFSLSADETAVDSFSYTITDGNVEATATVTLLIVGQPDPVTVELVERTGTDLQQVSFRSAKMCSTASQPGP